MKTNSFTALALAMGMGILTLVGYSCQRETTELIIDAPQPGVAEAYLKLNVSGINDVVLRSSSIDPLRALSSLRLVFYSATEDPKVVSIKTIEVSEATNLSALQVKLKPQDYKLVAIANPTEELKKLTTQGAPLSRLTSPSSLPPGGFRSPSEGSLSIAMINDQGPISVSQSSFFTSESQGETLSIKLEPILARVLVFGEPQLSEGVKGQATPGFLVAGTQRETYIMRVPNRLSTGEDERPGDNSARTTRYAKSPVWDRWIAQAPTTTDQVRYFSYEVLKSSPWNEILASREAFDQPSKITIPYLYAPEATLPASAYLEATTPYVIIRYPFIPRGLELSAQEGWVSYRGVAYRESEVKRMIREKRIAPQELAQAIASAQITEASFGEGFDREGIRFYHEGYNYYIAHIKHFADATDYGHYGIVRGNEYRIRLVSIQGAGLPTPPDMSRALSPITNDKTSGKMAIEVLTPLDRDQSVDL